MADKIVTLFGLLFAAFFALMPYSGLTLVGLWLIGWVQKRSRRSNVARGSRLVWRLLVPAGWLGDQRQRHHRTFLWAGLAACCAVLVGSLLRSTGPQTPWLVAGCAAVLAGGGWWAWRHGAGQFDTLSDWMRHLDLRQQVEHAAQLVVPDAHVSNATSIAGTVTATVTVPPGANPDVSTAQFGTALEGALRSQFGHVDIRPVRGSQSKLALSVAVEPLPDPWRLLSQQSTVWPGPSTVDPLARVRIGFHVAPDGRTVLPTTIPNPCVDAEFVFVTGMPRVGKTGTMQTVIAEFAHRPHVTLELLDPEMVEFGRWAPRARVSLGVHECVRRIVAIHEHLELRRRVLAVTGYRHWVPEVHGPLLLICCDELASLWSEPVSYKDEFGITVEKLRGLLIGFGQRGGKLGVGLVLGTQRGDFDVIPTRLRDICPTKLAHCTGSQDGARMAVGDDRKQLYPIVMGIPRGSAYKGCSIVVAEADEDGPPWLYNRSFAPQAAGHGAHESIAAAVETIAQSTAHLRPEKLIYPTIEEQPV